MTAIDQPTTTTTTTTWARVCRVDQLVPGRGVAARVAERQVALFRWAGEDGDVVYAVDNRDPFSCAQVMSRGIVGDKGGVPKVASPVFKQNFDLRTGQCLDDEAVTLATYPVRVVDDGWIEVDAAGNGAGGPVEAPS